MPLFTTENQAFSGHLAGFWSYLGAMPIEQEKRLKYLDLVASAVILQNTVDMSLAIQTLSAQGEEVNRRYIKALSPYVTRHIKRYGDYIVNLQSIPQPLEVAISLPPEIFETEI